jgi:hypothetical protein
MFHGITVLSTSGSSNPKLNDLTQKIKAPPHFKKLVTCQLLIKEAQVRFLTSPCATSITDSGSGGSYALQTSVIPCQDYSTNAP